MIPLPAWIRSRVWTTLAAGLALAGGLVAWSRRDLDPPRAVIQAPDKSWPQGFTPDGRTFLTSGPEGVVAWDAATWRPRAPWSFRAVRVGAFSRDGRSCVGEHGYDSESAKIVRADIATGVPLQTFGAGLLRVVGLRFTADDRSIRAFLADRRDQLAEVVTWDLATGAESRRPITGPSGTSAWTNRPAGISPDGRVLAYLDQAGGIQLWDADADRALGPPLANPASPLAWLWSTCTFTPDGRRMVVGRTDGAVDLWDLAAGKLVRTIPVHPDGFAPSDVQISPDGRTLASAGSFHHAVRWGDRATLALKGLVHRGYPSLPDDGVVMVDLNTGRRLARWPGAFHPWFAPDGRTIVTHESWSGTFAARNASRPPAR